MARLLEIAKKEGLKADPEALGVMARAAEGSLRDALSLLEQARAYSGAEITDASVRELLGVVPEEALGELVTAIEQHSAEKVLELVHRFQKEGRNLQHFCRETIRHFRNLLVAKVCGADSELIAATPEQRPELARAAALFSEEDLTRYFQILLDTDDDLRRKPDPRIHLEMGLLRMVNAARLAPLEKVLAELNGEGSPRIVRRALRRIIDAIARRKLRRQHPPREFPARLRQHPAARSRKTSEAHFLQRQRVDTHTSSQHYERSF